MEVFRGTATAFEATFLDQDGAALVPADPQQYPQVVIKDPDGEVITTTVGSPLGSGIFRVAWYCPDDATVNQPDTPWRVDWFFLTGTGHSRSSAETFDVVDKVTVDPQERAQNILIRDGGSARPMLRWPRRLPQISLTIKQGSGDGIVKQVDAVATTPAEQDRHNAGRLIVESRVDGQYSYHYDTDALVAGEYNCFWEYQESEVSQRDTDVQIIQVVPDIFWHYALDIRKIVDKLQKRIGTVQAYAPSDVYTYLRLGLDFLNFVPPTTNWSLAEIPLQYSRGIRGALIYASCIQALIAQQICEEELQFTHTGLQVNITVKHDYAAVLSAIKLQLDAFALAKPQLFRLAEGVAWSGARPKNWRMQNRTFRIDRGLWSGLVPPDGSALLRNIGL
jgi:hypothetical protein